MAVAPTEAEVQRVEVDGIPVFWSEAPGPGRIALVFRTGRADEVLVRAGLTHLVEHLALFSLGPDDRRHNGFVDHLRTVFHANGSEAELLEFAASVSAALAALPLERVEQEKRVLLTEAATAQSGSWHGLMGLRFGAQGFGLVDYQEFGLRRPGTGEVAAWCRRRFVAGNAAIWMTGRPPESLGLGLPNGERAQAPSAMPIRGLELPAYVSSNGGGVAVSFVGQRSVELTIALTLLQRRLHEGLRIRRALSYSASGSYVPLTSELAHLTLGADCLDEHATAVRDQLVEELHRLADDGPSSREIADATEAINAGWAEDPMMVLSDLDVAVTNELLGARQTTRDELREEYRQLSPDAIAGAVRAILPTALLSAPTGNTPPAGFHRYESGPAARPDGHRYLTRGRRSRDRPRKSPFVASEDGISYLADPPSDSVSIRFDHVAAVLELGRGRFALIAANGDGIRVDTNMLVKGRELEELIRQQLPEEFFIPLQDRPGGNILDLSREKIGLRTPVAREIELLPRLLEPGERVLTMAAARHKRQSGLLALTNRRLIHLSKAATAKPRTFEIQLADVARARGGRLDIFSRRLVVKTGSGKTNTFSYITPSERVLEFEEALASPLQPDFTPQPVDTSARARFRAYGVGVIFVLIGLVALATHQWAAVLIPLVWGSRFVFHNVRRRRERSRYND